MKEWVHLFNQLRWNIYVLGQKDININGIWKLKDRVEEDRSRFVILVHDILAVLEDPFWMYELGNLKCSHFTQEDNRETLTLKYCAIYDKHELVYLNFYDSEKLIKQENKELELVLHKEKKVNTVPVLYSQAIKNKTLSFKEFLVIEETFFLVCYRIGRLLRKKEIWQAKVIEHQQLRRCFQQVYHELPNNEWIEGRHLKQEINDCLSNFQVNTTWERLFYYIRIFELIADYLYPQQSREVNHHYIKVIKNSLYEMFHSEQQEKVLTFAK